MKQYTLRIEEKILEKLRHIAKYECRSVNKMVTIILRKYIQSFEKLHGEIKSNPK